jgi:Cys-rich repeat protein
MRLAASAGFAFFGASGIALVIACSSAAAKYPKCERDDQCAVSGKHDYCVGGACVYCRSSTDCGDRERCRAGKCENDPDLPPPRALDAGDDAAEGGDEEDAGAEPPDDESAHEGDRAPVNPRQMPRGIRRYLRP